MALIRFTHGELIGSMGNNTWQRGPFGAILRARTTPVNPNSPAQVDIRATLALLSDYWRSGLTQAQRDGWQAYGEGTPWTNKFGDPVILPGRQHFIRFNMALQNFTASIRDDAPAVPGLPTAPTGAVFTTVAAAGLILTALDGAPPSAGSFFFLYSSVAPYNPTKNFFKGPFIFNRSIANADVFPITIKTAAEVAAGQRWFTLIRYLQVPLANGPGGFTRDEPIYTHDMT